MWTDVIAGTTNKSDSLGLYSKADLFDKWYLGSWSFPSLAQLVPPSETILPVFQDSALVVFPLLQEAFSFSRLDLSTLLLLWYAPKHTFITAQITLWPNLSLPLKASELLGKEGCTLFLIVQHHTHFPTVGFQPKAGRIGRRKRCNVKSSLGL